MNQCIGTCSICGGQVVGYMGAWMGIVPPPPPPTCSQCGAVAAANVSPVIPMVPAPAALQWTPIIGTGTSTNLPLFGKTWRA